jgi:hypothetical protein
MLQLISWLVLALVHVTPAIAFFNPAILTRLYGIVGDNPLFLLMQHRAALFLAVFAACLWAAFDPAPRKLATLVVAISMISFLILYWRDGSPTALRTIARADMIGLPFLAIAAWKAFSP